MLQALNVLSHSKILDVNILTSTCTPIIFRKENCSSVIAEDLDSCCYKIDNFEITSKIYQL